MNKKAPKTFMDDRCPRQLEDMPESWCPLGVLRLKAIRNAGRELSEEEEANLPGCPWAVDHQLANYCFWKYISEYTGDKSPSDIEVASLMNISTETAKKTEKNAIQKFRESPEFIDLVEDKSGNSVQGRSEDDYTIIK
jgi:hypothetical protein